MNDELKKMLESVIANALKPIQQDVQNIQLEIQNIQQEVQTVKSQMNNRFDTIETKMSMLETKVSHIEAEQIDIKLAVLETNEKVKRLEAIQDSQQRIIELLSTRSLQQEAELKRIK